MIKPLFARVLLRRPKAEKFGSVLLPEMSQKRLATLRCKVIAKGPTADDSIVIGSEVLIGRFAGDWLNEDGVPGDPGEGHEFFICQDEDILAEVE